MPRGEDSFIEKFFSRNGAAAHHVTFQVADWDAALAACRHHDIPTFDDEEGVTDGAALEAHVHPPQADRWRAGAAVLGGAAGRVGAVGQDPARCRADGPDAHRGPGADPADGPGVPRRAPAASARGVAAEPAGYSAATWKEIVDLGWTGVAFDDSIGFLEACLLVEELGRFAVPLAVRVHGGVLRHARWQSLRAEVAAGRVYTFASVVDGVAELVPYAAAADGLRGGDRRTRCRSCRRPTRCVRAGRASAWTRSTGCGSPRSGTPVDVGRRPW